MFFLTAIFQKVAKRTLYHHCVICHFQCVNGLILLLLNPYAEMLVICVFYRYYLNALEILHSGGTNYFYIFYFILLWRTRNFLFSYIPARFAKDDTPLDFYTRKISKIFHLACGHYHLTVISWFSCGGAVGSPECCSPALYSSTLCLVLSSSSLGRVQYNRWKKLITSILVHRILYFNGSNLYITFRFYLQAYPYCRWKEFYNIITMYQLVFCSLQCLKMRRIRIVFEFSFNIVKVFDIRVSEC